MMGPSLTVNTVNDFCKKDFKTCFAYYTVKQKESEQHQKRLEEMAKDHEEIDKRFNPL